MCVSGILLWVGVEYEQLVVIEVEVEQFAGGDRRAEPVVVDGFDEMVSLEFVETRPDRIFPDGTDDADLGRCHRLLTAVVPFDDSFEHPSVYALHRLKSPTFGGMLERPRGNITSSYPEVTTIGHKDFRESDHERLVTIGVVIPRAATASACDERTGTE